MTVTPLKDNDDDDKKPSASLYAAAATVTPAPVATRPTGAHRNVLMEDYSSYEDDDGIVKTMGSNLMAVAKKMPAAAAPSAAAAASRGGDGLPQDEKSRSRRERLAAADTASSAMVSRKKPAKISPDEHEKTQARQARLQALEQQQESKGPRRQSGTADDCTKSSTAPPPRRRRRRATSKGREGEDEDVFAKRRARASPSQNIRKLAPPPSMAAQSTSGTLSSIVSMSTHSSGSSTAVTQNLPSNNNNNHKSAAQIRAVSWILEDDDTVATGEIVAEAGLPIPDTDAKNKARATSAGEKGQKRTPARRHSVAEADAAVKRSASMTSSELVRRGAARRRRATITGPVSGTSSGLMAARSGEDMMMGSKVGAHSVTGGRRASKTFKANEEEDDEDDDAVHQGLVSVASRQAQAAAGQLISKEEEDDDFEDEAVAAHRSSFASRISMEEMMILEEPEGDFLDDDNEGFTNGDRDLAELVAEAGVAVTPGAFAVEGMGDSGRTEDSDLISEEFHLQREGSGRAPSLQAPGSGSFHDPTLTSPTSDAFWDPEAVLEADEPPSALAAELYQVLEGHVLTYDNDKKTSKAKRRCLQCTGLCFLLAVATAVMAVIFSQWKGENPNSQGVAIPAIEGWNQIGSNLTGPTDDDQSLFGYSIAMDGPAQRIAIGLPGRDHGATELKMGEVHILDFNGTQWSAHQPIIGPAPNSQAGSAVAISKDGKRVAVGSPFFAPGGGQVSVYEEVEAGTWETVGQILVGAASKHLDERFGSSLALSDDGSMLAVGANMGDGADGADTGYLKVFRLKSYGAVEGLQQQWVQLGDTIFGENPGDFFGWSLAMSADGQRIAAGAVGSSGGGIGEYTGQVRVFDYLRDSGSWTQAGPPLAGASAFDSFGSSVSLSSDGATVAVGAIGHSNDEKGVDIGHVRIFQLAGTPSELSWRQVGQTLVGQSAFDSFGHSVSLSEDGKVVAAGGPRNDEFSENSGQIQVFELDKSTLSWDRRGSNIGGSYKGRDLFGWSVALSADGSVVAGGAPFSTFDGRLNDVGTVRIYDVDEE